MLCRTLYLLLLLLPVTCSAQSTLSTIAGRATDEALKPLAEAAVTLTDVATGRVRTVRANAQGGFTFALLPGGTYELEVRAANHQMYARRIVLHLNQEVRVEAALGAVPRQSIEVTATRSLLRPESAALGTTIDNRMVVGLPLDGRNFLELSLLNPGAAPAAQGSAASVRGDFAFNVNGAREDANNFLLDGVYSGDPKLNTFGVNPPVDGVREFEVATSSYDASFGRNGGAQVNVILKSGTNALHGTAYEFFRNGALDARNYFAPAREPAPRYQRNQYGFSVGGPVRRNRTFLFGDYEGRRVREGITRVTNVPTALERGGDFSQSGVAYIVDPFTQQPFAGNRIPSIYQNPIGVAIANLYPLPNRTTPRQNYVSSPLLRDRNDQFDIRLDHQAAATQDLTVRYSFGDRAYFEPFSGNTFASVPGYGVDVPRRGQNAMLAHVYAVRPNLLNEARVAFNRVASRVLQQGRNGVTAAQVGLPVISRNARDAGLPLITLPGYSPIGDEYNNPQQSAISSYQALDTMTWIRGRSTLKFGFDVRRLQQNAFRDVQSRGLINFYGVLGDSLADLLIGLPVATGVARLDNPQYLRSSAVNLFVNETWRVTGRLTVNIGLRYELNTPPVDRYDRAYVYDQAVGGTARVGTAGVPRGAYAADRNNVAPRVGLAYALRPGTIVRAGYGVYYDQSALAPGEGLYFNPPLFDFRLYVSSAQFPLMLQDPFPANYPFPSPPSATAFQRDLKTAYMQHWNWNIQQSLGNGRVVEMGYVGSKGTHLVSARDINQPGPSVTQFPLRPNPRFDDVNIIESRASSNYHSLQTRFQQRFSRGLSALGTYTFGKSIDDASGFFNTAGDANFPQDSRNTRLERARSAFDVRHRLSVAYAYDLPFGKGRWRGGWQTNGIWSFQTGRPFTVALLQQLDNSGTGRSSLGFGANDRPDYLRNAALSNQTPERWFDTTAFAMPRAGMFGNAGRNVLEGPGMQTVNASVLKNFAITETTAVQLRVEAFNLFNRVNLDLPDNFFGSPTFGRISSAQAPRHVQLGLKLVF
ncbi:MAG: TonB-dependent receptor [Bryobacterales bacterium]|nr:TonB-dependent receptor [Bryobacterales bacterium]